MLDNLHKQTCTLKMMLAGLGMVVSPPACRYSHKLKQMNADFNEMAGVMGYTSSNKIFLTSSFVYSSLVGRHFHIQNLQDLALASDVVLHYMMHYFDKSFNAC